APRDYLLNRRHHRPGQRESSLPRLARLALHRPESHGRVATPINRQRRPLCARPAFWQEGVSPLFAPAGSGRSRVAVGPPSPFPRPPPPDPPVPPPRPRLPP